MYHAKDLARMSKDDLWALPDGPMKVVFDDGVLETNKRATVYSVYMWDYYVQYPNTPALKYHHLGSMRIGAETHMTLLERVMWDSLRAYPEIPDQKAFIEDLSRLAYVCTNNLYNDMTYRLEAYVTSISAIDFVQALEHPAIKEANDTAQPNRLSIDKTHAKIEAVLRDPRELVGNTLATVAKNGLVSMSQILQCIGPRGFLTDVDSQLFPHPVMVGFAHGLTTLHDKMVESRSAGKALTFTEKPLQETEYFNRRLQLLAATLADVTPGDCGSQKYMNWHVEGNDLAVLAGKYYLTEQGLRVLQENDTHLRGEVIRLRTIFHCLNKDTTTVCATCFGDLQLSIPKNTNLGHVCATAMCEKVSQKVLSVKHDDKNQTGDIIELSEIDQKYIRVIAEPPSIKLASRMASKRVILTLKATEANRLPSIEYTEDVRDLKVSAISDLITAELTIVGKDKEERVVVPVSAGTNHSSMSHELLDYVKRKRWTLDQLGNFVIDLCDWDIELPLFVLPPKATNMLDYMKTIEAFLKASRTSTTGKRSLLDHETPESALREFNQIVSSQLKVNIAHLEVLVKVTMVASSKNKDYRIPLEGNVVEWGTSNDIMSNRSLGATMAYEKHKHVFNNPRTFLTKVRPPHILDPILMPFLGYTEAQK